MADSLRASFDLSAWDEMLAKLQGPARESLARRMCVSGGVIMRDEAKQYALRPTTHVYNPTSRGSHEAGILSDSIYLAFRDKVSTELVFTYSVTWNDKKAFWGKFREFGYRIIYPFYVDAAGMYHTYHGESSKTPEKLAHPFFVKPTPFLRPAFDASQVRVKSAMLQRGIAELPILLRTP